METLTFGKRGPLAIPVLIDGKPAGRIAPTPHGVLVTVPALGFGAGGKPFTGRRVFKTIAAAKRALNDQLRIS